MSRRLAGHAFLVTGATGMAATTARRSAAEGAAVLARCRAATGRIDGLFAVAGGSGRRHGDGIRGAVVLIGSVLAASPAPAPFATHAYAAAKGVLEALSAARQPLAGGLLDPEDVGEAALFLLSAEARRITGQSLAVDGGWSVSEGHS